MESVGPIKALAGFFNHKKTEDCFSPSGVVTRWRCVPIEWNKTWEIFWLAQLIEILLVQKNKVQFIVKSSHRFRHIYTIPYECWFSVVCVNKIWIWIIRSTEENRKSEMTQKLRIEGIHVVLPQKKKKTVGKISNP